MANYPKKMQDPAESALSAIQEALGTAGQGSGQPSCPCRAGRASGRPSPHALNADKDLFEGVGPSSTAEDQPQARRAANDDRQSIGMILQTLQRQSAAHVVSCRLDFRFRLGAGRPDRSPFLYLPDLRTVLSQGATGIPAMIGLAAFVLAPVMFFYLLAHMVWRSQELAPDRAIDGRRRDASRRA